MGSNLHKQERSGPTGRREFCRKVPCAALGILASPGALASPAVLKDITNSSAPTAYQPIKTKHNMANMITAKVISQKGHCGMGHQVGDEITITEEGVQGKICIHALYSFLPKAFAMMYDSQFPWLEDPDVSTSACPDAYNPVIFEIRRRKASIRV